ncbi:hypothetical protein G9A89_010693 [Geosiphon pyriformis]|nr:hypothetical protein G9A89_010693 [Geosiphon pyriformis]
MSFSNTSETNKRYKILITKDLLPSSMERLQSAPDIELLRPENGSFSRTVLLQIIKGVDGILCAPKDKIDAELLDQAGPQLKVVSTHSVGYDHIDTNELRKRGIVLGFTPGVLTDATADIAIILILGAARRIRENIHAVLNREWNNWSFASSLGTQLTDKTIGIVGLGRIGIAITQRLQPFIGLNGKIIYTGNSDKPVAKELGALRVDFETLLRESDVISVSCTLNEKTREMFNYEAFKKMKKSVIFVNTARGGIVQQDDLVRALSEGLIGSVGLDVTTPEPLDSDHPLLKFQNVLVLPHIGTSTIETRTMMGNMSVDNVLAGVRELKLPSSLDL